MRLGVFVAYWPWFTYNEQVALARQADRLGFDSVWVAEGYGQEAVAILGALSAVTERIKLGSGILQIPARQPAAAATAAATLDRISGGRLLLGLGLSGPQVSEGWYGVPFTAPLRRTREYVEIVRKACSGERLTFSGREWTIPSEGGLGLGKPLRMLGDGPVQDRIPIYLGVGGPKTVEQCGEIADGWFPFLFSPEHAEMLTEPLLRGLANAGRDRSTMTVATAVPAAVHADLDTARDLVRPLLAFYLGGMGSKDKNFYTELAVRYGHGASARACQDRFLAGDRSGAEAALTPELIDLVSIAATPATLEKNVARFADAGVDTLVVVPFGDRPAVLDALAAVAT
ncbi:LLM class F420-dependent oxidoreductase [Pseudonocardia yuanmonensis]|uniref:LLM class F420-dependent oxidoreductase n=1 Tax=Pseudonocardia yuanmonensis TaxID=1095914 RepID=A0ABP8X7F2_9PSEU